MLPSFFQKPLGIATILGAAVGAPYAAFETEQGISARRAVGQWVGYSTSPTGTSSNELQAPFVDANQVGAGYASPYGYASNAPYAPYPTFAPSNLIGGQVSSNYLGTAQGTASPIPGSTPQLWNYTIGTPSLPQIQMQPGSEIGGGVVSDLREVLRFDITPAYLTQRFSRVTTVLSNVNLDGVRTPVVTGTRQADIAGTLTYYFDRAKSVQRIQLHGLTGDPSEIANLMVQQYGLRPEQSLGGQLFTIRWNNRVTSVVNVSPAPIIYAGADHSKYILFIELNQPSTSYGLSDEAAAILQQAQAIQRW